MKKALKIGAYARTALSGKISVQTNAIKDWCKQNDLIFVDLFIDNGYSANDFNRPNLQAMLTRSNEFDAIVVTSLDRLSRNRSDLNNIIDVLNKHSVALISLDTWKDETQ